MTVLKILTIAVGVIFMVAVLLAMVLLIILLIDMIREAFEDLRGNVDGR